VVQAICSDHQPHEEDAKQAPFPATQAGISALETLLPLTLRLVEDGVLSLREALARLTTGPAHILGIEAGTLAPGRLADICIFDPRASWVVGADTLRSRGHNTPFTGWEMLGRVTHTLYNGRLVFSLDGETRHG
jgi:dihydroorotase